jgi:sarcosine oxidase / L-pipecolate oxidase
MSSYDFVVVGAGTFGRSTALYLTLQFPEAKCALVEQYKLGHVEGSSHSKIRIIRSAYKHPFYRDLALQAIEHNWPQMEKLFNSKFILENPFLVVSDDEELFRSYQ